jgi:hypothetical protein
MKLLAWFLGLDHHTYIYSMYLRITLYNGNYNLPAGIIYDLACDAMYIVGVSNISVEYIVPVVCNHLQGHMVSQPR